MDTPIRRSDFRYDINGLRAIAVALVVLYHFNIPLVRGGFIGVDVFFVISGYLMTKIIEDGIASTRFSLLAFWQARAVRIIPALALLVVAVLGVGFFLLEPRAYEDAAKSAAAASFFVSDWKFALERGYFTPSSEGNWFLHTWSLSVEWQFYVCYPVFYLLMSRFGWLWRKRLLVLAGIAAGSFLANALMVHLGGKMATFAFFLMPLRAWEMLIGGLVFLLSTRRLSVSASCGLELGGLVLVFLSSVVFSRLSAWPSFGAMLPALGASAIILANKGDRSLLRAAPLQAIGSASYSIYLWHWPIAVGRTTFGDPSSGVQAALGILASIVLGFLSYRFVENPTRRLLSSKRQSWRTLAKPFAASLVAFTTAACIVVASGLPSRAKGDLVIFNDAVSASNDWIFPHECTGIGGMGLPGCFTKPGAATEAIVFGDSHAQMYRPRFMSAGWPNVEFITSVGCAPVPMLDRREGGFDCLRFHEEALKRIRESKARKIVYASIWVPYFDPVNADGMGLGCVAGRSGCTPVTTPEQTRAVLEGLRAEVRSLIAMGKEVAIVLPVPAPHYDVPAKIREAEFTGVHIDLDIRLSERPKAEELVRALLIDMRSDGAVVLDPRNFLCRNGVCPLTTPEGRTLYKDGNHLRPFVPENLNGFFEPFLRPNLGS